MFLFSPYSQCFQMYVLILTFRVFQIKSTNNYKLKTSYSCPNHLKWEGWNSLAFIQLKDALIKTKVNFISWQPGEKTSDRNHPGSFPSNLILVRHAR